MGFCLAEIGFSLVVPKDPAAFSAGLPGLATFALSFMFVSVLWWFHHKLFVTYFVLSPLTVVLNFTMLGSLALAIYFQQAVMQIAFADLNPFVPARYWMAALAVVYGIVCVQYVIGIRSRCASLSERDVRWGVNRVFRTGAVTVLFATFAIALSLFGHLRETTYAMLGILVVLGIVRRILVPKISERLLAGRS